MTSKLARVVIASAFILSVAALAQTGGAATGASMPSAPSAAASGAAGGGAPAPAVTNATGTKVGTINIEQAIFASNEGQREFEVLSKKLEPKQNEIKGLNDELEGLKKQLNTQGDKLNDQTRGTLVKQIEQKQKSFDRIRQDAQDDFQAQQGEIVQKILQKMGPLIVKYASDNGFGVILDTSNQWPQGPVLWYGPSVDITRPVVEAYNVQSGVPAPANAAPSAGRTGAPATKPATAPATKPATPPPSKPQPPK